MKFEELMQYGEGDIVTLSDFQTQAQFDDTEVDFRIVEVRTYEEPDGAFSYKGYIVTPPDEGEDSNDKYMILLMQCGEVEEIRVYYLDTEDELYLPEEDQDECPLHVLIDFDNEGLKERMEAHIETEEGNRDVTWDLQDQTHGVRVNDGKNEFLSTLGDYCTIDDNGGNNYCLIDWRGEPEEGWMEIWYGCIIKEHEIEILSTDGE